MGNVKDAEEAIKSLHDKEILLKNRRDTGPIQVHLETNNELRQGLK